MRVFIGGVAGNTGRLLAERLLSSKRADAIAGLDDRPCYPPLPGLRFVRAAYEQREWWPHLANADVAVLLTPLRWIEAIRRERPAHEGWQGRWPSSTTQFVVGAVGESDLELLNVTHYLTRAAGLRRAYFSAFRPIADTPLSDHPAENPWRQHRLYQASYLFRDYGFDLEEMPFDNDGRLPLDTDPKRAWADEHLREAPLEVNTATRQALMRVPGIGAKGAERIVAARRKGRLRSLSDLRGAGVANVERAATYLLLDGRRPVEQPRLF